MKRVVGFALFFVAIGMIFSYLVEGFLEFLIIVIFFLMALSEKNKHAYEASFRGETLEVLIEEKVRRNGKDGYRGHTERYIDIFVEKECMHRICGREVDIINHIVQIPYGME